MLQISLNLGFEGLFIVFFEFLHHSQPSGQKQQNKRCFWRFLVPSQIEMHHLVTETRTCEKIRCLKKGVTLITGTGVWIHTDRYKPSCRAYTNTSCARSTEKIRYDSILNNRSKYQLLIQINYLWELMSIWKSSVNLNIYFFETADGFILNVNTDIIINVQVVPPQSEDLEQMSHSTVFTVMKLYIALHLQNKKKEVKQWVI